MSYLEDPEFFKLGYRTVPVAELRTLVFLAASGWWGTAILLALRFMNV